ncbi:flavin reductase family protein [Leifsonia sp. 2TAF2]|uniref:flavin reductase family protein n=1 Tax=Leifsonia sp. 2TAF2 TaxID=3233009 RepID=UPI003F9AA354
MTAAEAAGEQARHQHGGHRVINPAVLYVGTPVLLLASRNDDGGANLAPASSYWALGRMLALGLEADGHTLANLRERPQLTVNFPSPPLWPAVEQIADLTGKPEVPEAKAARYAYSADKFAAAGLTPQPSDLVDPPRVLECLLQLEAQVRRVTPGVTGDYAIVEAEVVRVHADSRIVRDGDHIDPLAWQPIVYSFRHYFGIGEPLGARGSAAPSPADRWAEEQEEPEGGDAACWLASICPECGAMREATGACRRCGAA